MFKPWVGDKYGALGNAVSEKKVLVVGESHHAEEHEIGTTVPDMTQDVLLAYASDKRAPWMRTLDNFAWAVSGTGPSGHARDEKRSELSTWNSLAFYNYIPVVLAKGARSNRPTASQYRSAKEPFEQVIRDLKPDVLLVWGYTLFPWIIHNHFNEYDGDPWWFKGEWIDLPREPSLRAVRLLHPSTAFSWVKWHAVIQRAITS